MSKLLKWLENIQVVYSREGIVPSCSNFVLKNNKVYGLNPLWMLSVDKKVVTLKSIKNDPFDVVWKWADEQFSRDIVDGFLIGYENQSLMKHPTKFHQEGYRIGKIILEKIPPKA